MRNSRRLVLRIHRRIAIKILLFVAVVFYGFISINRAKHLASLLEPSSFSYDATKGKHRSNTSIQNHVNKYNIDTDNSDDNSKHVNNVKFRQTPFHKHIYVNQFNNHNNGVGSISNNTTRISFQLHDPTTVALTNAFNLYVTCKLGQVMLRKRRKAVPTNQTRTGEIPPSLYRVENIDTAHGVKRSGRVLDFTTTISSDLKILLVGDSVMAQLAEAFDEMIGGEELQSRKVIWESWPGHEGGTAVGPTRGGGVSAFWRMTGLLSMSMKGKAPANANGGGWSDVEIGNLLGHEYPIHPTKNGVETMAKVEAFDVVVFRVMHGWMLPHEITHDRLVEAIELSYELLGAKTVVLMNIPFTNNVKTTNYGAVQKINSDILDIANNWHLRYKDGDDGKGVRHVLVQDYAAFYNHVIWSNARHIGYNVSLPLTASQKIFEDEGKTFLFDRLFDGGEFSPSISMVCANRDLMNNKSMCDRNILWMDGMHICPETMAARYGASVACLLGCVYNKPNGGNENDEREIRECEQECNEQFMSVMPSDESWIVANTTLASFSS